MNIKQTILALEEEMEATYEKLSDLRASDPPTPWGDYDFIGADGQSVRLGDLFGNKDSLILVHNMGRQCPYCTVWADGFSDSYHRIAAKAAFVVTSKETIEAQQKNIKERGWQFPMVSSGDNRILEDLGFLGEGRVIPGLAFFSKNNNGEIFYHSRHVFGSGDQFGMLWHVLDLVGKWDPAEYQLPQPQGQRG
jgi:predicted dithiol-disulfide oxidoreductase (DUF899 family)